ncbi:MAG: hypothetical protein LBF76_01910 [Holosporales bacterium]|jgi:hypothetical protein|nr:hypothetical protein [Holosporales bacterium]
MRKARSFLRGGLGAFIVFAGLAVLAQDPGKNITHKQEVSCCSKEACHCSCKQKGQNGCHADCCSSSSIVQRLSEKKAVGFFAVPRTNWFLKIFGKVKATGVYDVHATKNGPAYDHCLAQTILQPGEESKKGEFRFHARESRVGLETFTPLGGEINMFTFVDVDFFGSSQTEESLFTPLSLRVRCAYMTLGGRFWTFLFGQTHSTFNFGGLADPEVADFSGPTGFVGGGRRPQIRASYKGSSWSVDLALENPEGEYINKKGGTKFAQRVTDSYFACDQVPDVVVAFQGNSEKAEGRVYAMGRRIHLTKTDKSPDISVFGWGAGLSAGYQYVGQSRVYLQFGGGRGIGRYLGDANGYAVYLDDSNKAHTMVAFGGLVGIQQYWSECWAWRTSAAFGWTRINTHSDLVSHSYTEGTGTSATTKYAVFDKEIRSFMINTFCSPFGPSVDIGIEWLHGDRILKVKEGDPSKGTIDRFIITIKSSFSS